MPTIEELPDDHDASSTIPALPPSLAATRNQSTSDFLASLSKMPLFSSSTDEADPDQLAAFTALAYEGTPTEIATNFRLQGNDSFKAKSYRDAIKFYTQALTTPSLPPDDPIREICLVNRAAANLELKNYGSVLKDCSAAMKLNPGNIKAHYRATGALAALSRWEEAIEIANRGLELDPTNKPLKLLLTTAQTGHKAAEAKRQKEAQEQAELRRNQYALKSALRTLGVQTKRSPGKAPELEGHKISLIDVDGDTGVIKKLLFPVIVLYPLHAQSDFVPTWREDETSEERLGGEVLSEPPPWDSVKEYTWKGVDVFMETTTGGLVKVGKKVPLGEVLGGGKVEVVDELVKLMVIPRGKRDGWIEEWKKRRNK